MNRTLKLAGLADGRAIDEECAVDFSDSDWQTLLDFKKNFLQVLQLPQCKERRGVSISISSSRDGKTVVDVTIPADFEVAAFLLLMRPIILSDEYCSFEKVQGLFGRAVSNSHFRRALKRIREEFDTTSFQRLVTIHIDGRLLNCESTLRLWLNAEKYHKDRTQQAELASFKGILPDRALVGVFLFILLDKLNAAGKLVELVQAIERGEEKQSVRLPQ